MKFKHIILSLIFFSHVLLNAQTKVSINNSTVSISPSFTISNGSSISVSGQVKNTGNTNITGNVHVNLAIDTSSNGVPKYFKRSTSTTPVVGFAPNSIFNFTVTDVASGGNSYKINGNGTTVVVWSVVGLSSDTITSMDSAITHVYVVDLTNINDLSFKEQSTISIQNPLTESLKFIYNKDEFVNVELLNSEGKVVISNISDGYIELDCLAKGLYYIKFTKRDSQFYVKKIVIN